MIHECSSFDFVKIHLMLQYDKLIQRLGHVVKNSNELQ